MITIKTETIQVGSSTSELVPVSSTTPQLPFDIIDYIFSFLKSHPNALFACSRAHPILSHIVERYRFHHIIIASGPADFAYSFRVSDLLRYLSEAPRIVNYVAVMQVEFGDRQDAYLEEIASLLPMFPMLECFMFPARRRPTRRYRIWRDSDSALLWKDLPQSFRTAVENCLHLPTMREVHVGNMSFPLSTLDNHANIDYLSLSRPPETERQDLETAHPQIKSLALQGFEHEDSEVFRTWAKKHILELQTLKYDFSRHEIMLTVFGISSNTLKNLYLSLNREGPETSDTVDLSSLPHLQHLTVHAEVHISGETWRTSFLGRAVETIKTAPSVQELTIEIYVDPTDASWPDIDDIDFSPLIALTESSSCYPHIDLYIYTGSPRFPFTHAKIGSLLAKHEDLVRSIEQGVFIIHPEEAAPPPSPRSYVAKEYEDKCIIM